MSTFTTLKNKISAYGVYADEVNMVAGQYYDGEDHEYIYTALQIKCDTWEDYDNVRKIINRYKVYAIITNDIFNKCLFIVRASEVETIRDADRKGRAFHGAFELAYHETHDGKKAIAAGIAAVEKYITDSEQYSA